MVRGADSQSGRSHRESREKHLCCQGREGMFALDNIRMSTQTLTIQPLLEMRLAPCAPRLLLRGWFVLGTMILGAVCGCSKSK